MENKTRGLRNNNPFNIKKSNNHWIGKVKGNDKVFETFDSLEDGYRSGLVLLSNYYKKYKLHTIYDIVKRFAPKSENDLSKYVEFLCNRTLLLPREKITLEDLLIRVAPQMSYYESHFIPEVYFDFTKIHFMINQLIKK